MTRTLLLTGFEPFGGDRINPSQGVAEALDGLTLGSVQVRSALLPVDAARAPGVLLDHIEAHAPEAVVLTGLASGRTQLSVERVALNVLDFRIPDNAGVVRRDEPVVRGGPDAYLSTLPLRAMVSAWQREGIPGYVSDTAGLYLCNLVMYVARHALGPAVPCGFLHLPANAALALESRSPIAYLPQTEIERGVRVAVETVARHLAPVRADVRGV